MFSSAILGVASFTVWNSMYVICMRGERMSRTIVMMLIMAAFSVNAFGEQDYDACLKQQQSLKSKEFSSCSGLQYLFNPSGCFATRKALKEFDEGKCTKIGRVEKILPGPIPSKASSEPAKSLSELKNEVPLSPEVKVRQSVPERIIATVPDNPELDACRKQEQELKSKEIDQCSGIKYTFNPSGCFSARRILKEFEESRCRKIEVADKASFNENSNKTIPKDPPVVAAPVTSPLRVNPSITPAADTLPKQPGETEKLREENARIKAENDKLKAEMEQLRRSISK